MSDETKNPTPQAEELAQPSEETKPVDQVEQSEEAPSQDSEYEDKLRLLEEEKSKITEERDNLKSALAENREIVKALKGEASTEEKSSKSPQVDKDQLRQLVDEVANEKVQTLRTDLALSTFKKVLGEMTTHPKEAELIKHYYKSSIKPSGVDEDSIRFDLLLAKAAANREHIQFGNQPKFDSRVATAMSVSGGKDAGSRSKPSVDMSDKEKRLLQDFGVDPQKAAEKLAAE